MQEFRTTLETLCTRLTGGETTPMKQDIAKDETSCTYCPYGSICLYDLK